jgi:putative OPT family oligopeptide transporter
VGGAEENAKGLRTVVMGTVGGALYPVLAKLKLVSESAETTMRLGAGATTWSGSLSLMLLGVGHLVGLTVGLAMLAGVLISFVGLLPALTAGGPPPGTELASFVGSVFRHKVRFAGAGAIGIAAVWTLLKVIGPVLAAFAMRWPPMPNAARAAALPGWN